MAYRKRRLPDFPGFGRDGHALIANPWGTSSLALLAGWNPGDTEAEQDYFANTRESDVWDVADDPAIERGLWVRRMRRAPFSPRHNFGAAKVGTNVHLYGSDTQDGRYVMDHWVSPGPTTWRCHLPTNAGATMPVTDRVLAIPAVLPDGTPLMIGGETMPGSIGPSHAAVRRTDIWGLVAGTWTQLIANCPALPRSAVERAPIHNVGGTDYLYLISGGDYAKTALDRSVCRVEATVAAVSDPDAWEVVTEEAEFPGRIYASPVSWDGKLWLIGGSAPGAPGASEGGNLSIIWVSDDHGATWADSGLSIPHRHAAATAVWNDRIVIIGGSGDDHRKRDVCVIEKVEEEE